MPLDLAYGRKIYGWWGRHPAAYRVAAAIPFLGRESALRRAAVDRLGLRAGETVLDLACGPGVNFGLLEERIGSAGRLIGLDHSEEMLDSARDAVRRTGWDNVELVQRDAARLDLPEGRLDGAVCTLGLSAIPDHEAAIANVHRALRVGGTFVVLDARPLRGPGAALNPVIKPLFRYTTNWDHEKDLPAALRAVFGAVSVDEHNAGSIFVAAATKAR